MRRFVGSFSSLSYIKSKMTKFRNEINFMCAEIKAEPLEYAKFFTLSPKLKKIDFFNNKTDEEILNILNGKDESINFYATVYLGHQFGHFVPLLGDGRVAFLGESKNIDNNKYYELHLKGLGRTPFSRRGDGRAVFRSSLREYLASVYMEALGVPTTQAFALIDSKTTVYREEREWGAIVLRGAESFLRFGHFEFLYHHGHHKELEKLLDFTLEQYFPNYFSHPNGYALFYQEVVKRTAKLIALWQSVGFCHGVMNTDNMSVLGLTLDYGPYGFIEKFDLAHICNHSDHEGRYAYGEQPIVGEWNLEKFGLTLSPFVDENTRKMMLATYKDIFNLEYQRLMFRKLGLFKIQGNDSDILQSLLTTLDQTKVDYHLFFRKLSFPDYREEIKKICLFETDFQQWSNFFDKLQSRLRLEDCSAEDRFNQMQKINPKFVLRNYLAEQIIELHKFTDEWKNRDLAQKKTYELTSVLHDPFSEHVELEYLSQPTPKEYLHLEVSCSS